MFKKLQEIYKGKIIEPKNSFKQNEYYYFFNEEGFLFGIEKSISKNEYQLIKSMYIEKTFHFDNEVMQQIHEFLFEQGAYPFQKERGKFLLYSGLLETDKEQLHSTLKDIFLDIYAIEFLGMTIIIYFGKFDVEIESLFQALRDDFATKLVVHEGIFFNSSTSGKDLIEYVKEVNESHISKNDYSDVSDLVLSLKANGKGAFLIFIKQTLLSPIIKKDEYLEIIKVFFKTNLNASASAKLLYMHRNTLLYKLDQISKEIGLDIERFQHACAINVLLHLPKNKITNTTK